MLPACLPAGRRCRSKVQVLPSPPPLLVHHVRCVAGLVAFAASSWQPRERAQQAPRAQPWAPPRQRQACTAPPSSAGVDAAKAAAAACRVSQQAPTLTCPHDKDDAWHLRHRDHSSQLAPMQREKGRLLVCKANIGWVTYKWQLSGMVALRRQKHAGDGNTQASMDTGLYKHVAGLIGGRRPVSSRQQWGV